MGSSFVLFDVFMGLGKTVTHKNVSARGQTLTYPFTMDKRASVTTTNKTLLFILQYLLSCLPN